MNVKELKERLAEIPDHYEVLVDGYEDGHESIDEVFTGTFEPYRDQGCWFYGTHQFREDDRGERPAVLIGTHRHGAPLE